MACFLPVPLILHHRGTGTPDISSTPYTSPKVDGYPELDFPTLHSPVISLKVNGCVTGGLTSTDTANTSTLVNGYSPLQNLQGKRDDEKDLDNNPHSMWGHQAKLNNEILQQLKLTQGFLHSQGKKGFRFKDNPDHYESLVTIYEE